MKENLEKQTPVPAYQLPGTECGVISDQMEHKYVLIHNMSVIFNINHQGGTRSLKLLKVVHELWS